MTFSLTSTSRKEARKALAGLLSVLEGTLAQKVYDHAPADFVTSPVVFVRSAPAQRQPMGVGGGTATHNRLRLEVGIYVAAGTTETGWKTEDAQDASDDLEAACSQIIAANKVNAAWVNLALADQPTELLHLLPTEQGGYPYDVELITVEVETYDQ